MIKHVVLFRFKDDIAAEDRKNAFESFRSGIMSLVKIIPVIRKIEVGYNDIEKIQKKQVSSPKWLIAFAARVPFPCIILLEVINELRSL